MENTPTAYIADTLQQQRAFFAGQQTKDLDFRIENLRKLKDAIRKHETQITEALWKDLRKSHQEAYLTEISMVLKEIDNHIKNLKKWARPKGVPTPVHLQPSKSRIIHEPLGVALIIAPWNYPFQLLINPLVGALSAGCCAVLKPSESTPDIASVMNTIISDTFSREYVDMAQGGADVSEFLLSNRFDAIFFTGSTRIGKKVMKAASEYLTPVILELGGKSPCIVDKDADLDVAAKRIVWGKTVNAGQTCIAPDYLYVHASVKDDFIEKAGKALRELYGDDIQKSDFYARIVSDSAFDRLQKFMQDGEIKIGGQTDRGDRFISPTVIDQVEPESPVMQEEIFGPILPVLTFRTIDEPVNYINAREKPLALYYFGNNRAARDVFSRTSSGGGCINDTLMHISNDKLPFGGVGYSGLGKYHGKDSFLAFSHSRAVVTTPTWIDLPFRYPPYKFWNLIKRLM